MLAGSFANRLCRREHSAIDQVFTDSGRQVRSADQNLLNVHNGSGSRPAAFGHVYRRLAMPNLGWLTVWLTADLEPKRGWQVIRVCGH